MSADNASAAPRLEVENAAIMKRTEGCLYFPFAPVAHTDLGTTVRISLIKNSKTQP